MNDEIKVPYGMWGVNGQWMHNKNLGISEAEQRKRNYENGFAVNNSDDVFNSAKSIIHRLGNTTVDCEIREALVKCLDQLAQYELDNDYLNAIIDGSWAAGDEVIFNRRMISGKKPLDNPTQTISLETISEKLDELLQKI